jgi:hypothetical protein
MNKSGSTLEDDIAFGDYIYDEVCALAAKHGFPSFIQAQVPQHRRYNIMGNSIDALALVGCPNA